MIPKSNQSLVPPPSLMIPIPQKSRFENSKRFSMKKSSSRSYIGRKSTKLPRMTRSPYSNNSSQMFIDENKNQDRIMELLVHMQNKMLKKVKKNEERYIGAMNKLYKKINHLKERTNYIKVGSNQTTEEYLKFQKIIERRDKKKRLDCLSLLNTLGYSF